MVVRGFLVAGMVASLAILGACATAGGGDDDDTVDAGRIGFPDAGPRPDAADLPADAAPVEADAMAGGEGGFCESSADCTVSGNCCFIALCVPGTDIGGLCVPD